MPSPGTDTPHVFVFYRDRPTYVRHGVAGDNNRSDAFYTAMFQEYSDAIAFCESRIHELIGGPFLTIAGINTSTGLITTSSTHPFVANTPIVLRAHEGGALPPEYVQGTVYYWLADTLLTGKVAAEPGGAAIVPSVAGTGPMYVHKHAPAYVDESLSIETTSIRRYAPEISLSGEPLGAIAVSEVRDVPIGPPHGSTLTEIGLWLVTEVHAVLPSVKPKIVLVRIDGQGTQVEVATGFDTSPDAASYTANHVLKWDGFTEVVDRSAYTYRIRFYAESGSNSDSSGITGIYWEADVKKLDAGAGY